MGMTKDELIAKQQLEIEELKEILIETEEGLDNIHLLCVSIGGPLNDNCKRYTRRQMEDFFQINTWAEAALSNIRAQSEGDH